MSENVISWGAMPSSIRMELASAGFASNADMWYALPPTLQRQLFTKFGGSALATSPVLPKPTVKKLKK